MAHTSAVYMFGITIKQIDVSSLLYCMIKNNSEFSHLRRCNYNLYCCKICEAVWNSLPSTDEQAISACCKDNLYNCAGFSVFLCHVILLSGSYRLFVNDKLWQFTIWFQCSSVVVGVVVFIFLFTFWILLYCCQKKICLEI